MKIIIIVTVFLIIFLTACNKNKSQSSIEKTTVPLDISTLNKTTTEQKKSTSKILVVYFTMPENAYTSEVDAIAEASVVVKDGKVFGNTQYVAEIIAKTLNADLFKIETTEKYQLEHKALLEKIMKENKKSIRPELSTQINNLEDYDTIFLGYPIWIGDLPLPVYTFLEKNNLRGKAIIPFCTHGGSKLANTINTIAKLQPRAKVNRNGFEVLRDNVKNSENDIIIWLKELGI